MPRQARIVIPDIPHHVIQRGNRRQDVFFDEEDYKAYLALLKDICAKANLRVLAYCLMTNHVHLIVIPCADSGLRPIGEAHRCYTHYINMKKDWRGYLWQGRFASYPMDENYCLEAMRYVELNPVRAGLCSDPCDYRWSSARQRVGLAASKGDFKVDTAIAVDDWVTFWKEGLQRHDMIKLFDDNETALRALGVGKSPAMKAT